MKLYIISFLLLFFSVEISMAQEIPYPLNNNQVLIGNNLKNKSVSFRTVADSDTLSLPFIDDFAQEGIYPSTSLWLDSMAFINSTFCDNPPTVGVATFDGIDKFGNRYSTSSFAQYCDTLTSKPIRLAFAISDTTIWFSFYYQPQGLGLAPVSTDSLLLLFKDTSETWNEIWHVTGTSDQPFQRVNIHLTDARYFFDGFQFRFMNYGPPNKNSDHWNIDYVYLNNNRFNNDSLTDVGIINNPGSILSEYSSMPWPHYSVSVSSRSSMLDSARNINYGPTTVKLYYNIYDESGSSLFRDSLIDGSSYSGKVSQFSTALNGFTYPHTSTDSATFLIKDSLSNNGVFNLNNDVSTYHQNFCNYYAYDDGSAESSAGLSGTNLKWAMEYNVKMSDTLRGVQIYFNPASTDVSNQLIQIAYWSNVIVGSNTDNLVYRMVNKKPYNVDSINGFANYLFDVTLPVSTGNIWVGFIQNDDVLIGVGVDRNNDARPKMFYASNNQWNQSTIKGAWMIRPLFGKQINIVDVDEIASVESTFEVFPVPSDDKIHFSFANAYGMHELHYEINDITGRTAMSGKLISDELTISQLNAGIYFVKLTDKNNHTISGTGVKKIVIYH
jgi:hypothetical protein